MSNRRLLIIGSQCEGRNHLRFLPDVAERLHELMTKGPGECVGVPLVGNRPPGLLLDPTAAETEAAIKAAIDGAAKTGDSLILVYVGHGEYPNERTGDFYLMPTDGRVNLARVIKERIEFAEGAGLGGLAVLLDACQAGAGVWDAMEQWAQARRGKLQFEFLTATGADDTHGAPLIHELIKILERGAPDRGDQITCDDVHGSLERGHFPTQYTTYNAPNLSLGRNIAKDPGDVFWKDSASRSLILQSTHLFQPTPLLSQLVETSRKHSVVILTGESGVGKSALAAVMARPELTGDRVPKGFVHAVAMLLADADSGSLARDLESQLRRSLPAFEEAIESYKRSVTWAEYNPLDPLRKRVLGPLEHVAGDSEVRIVLDGFNQLSDVRRAAIGRELLKRPDRLRLILTAHHNTPDLPPGEHLEFEKATPEDLNAYLESRGAPEPARAAIIDKSRGSWLIASLLTDAVLDDPKRDPRQLPDTVDAAYDNRLKRAGAYDAWNDRFGPVLAALAVAGFGPILPTPLLVQASANLGGPSDEESVQSVLAPLRGLVVRDNAEPPTERVGLFHATLAECLLRSPDRAADYAITPPAAHRALSAAIDALAPSASHQRDDPLHRYAFHREAHHLWEIGEFDRTRICLLEREVNMPKENLERWSEWLPRLKDQLGTDDPNTLTSRSHIAHWTGEAGDATRALTLFTQLLPDMVRVFGPDHPETLKIRNNIAGWTGEAGDATGALTLFTQLLLDTERTLGPNNSEALRVRGNVATWTGKVGNTRKALSLHNELLPDMERVLGPDHPVTLETRGVIAALTIETGDAREALNLFRDLRPDMTRVLGANHPATLRTRSNIAHAIGETGDAREALALYEELLPDMERALGADHPNTLTARNNIASWTGDAGDATGALTLYTELLPDMERVFGVDHPNTLKTQGDIAKLTGELGDTREALRICDELLPNMTRRLGADHHDTLTLLSMIGALTIQAGNRSQGCQHLREALDRAEARYGPGHALTTQLRQLFDLHACNQPSPSIAFATASPTTTRPR